MRAIVNVSTGRYVAGQQRLQRSLNGFDGMKLFFRDQLPPGSPSHRDKPYAFKYHAISEACRRGATTILWADASIVVIRDLEPLWRHIEEHGYWINANGWNTGQWCIDAALDPLGITREESWDIPHPVAGAFGLDLTKVESALLVTEMLRLSRTGAFRGPWRVPPCIDRLPGPKETGGHRHDQTALGVAAWRLGWQLHEAPKFFSYYGGETDATMLIAQGI